MLRVKKIETKEELAQAFEIRRVVFIEGQNCPDKDEFDEFDEESTHLIAYIHGEPVGTSRFRSTSRGVKLERFAVLDSFRGQGIGKRLVETALGQIEKSNPKGTLLYLHAQLAAMPLYARHGFVKVGEKFEEVGIEHFEMEKVLD